MTARLRLTDRADLAVYYEADAQQYPAGAAATQIVSKEVFMAFYAGCASVGFEMDGKPIGGLLFDGRSAHIAVLPALPTTDAGPCCSSRPWPGCFRSNRR